MRPSNGERTAACRCYVGGPDYAELSAKKQDECHSAFCEALTDQVHGLTGMLPDLVEEGGYDDESEEESEYWQEYEEKEITERRWVIYRDLAW